ncbi:DNA-binding response regulator [Actinomyces sp. Z5]|uniref:response regulator n=1 Tax=Actinomyces sp. Z5 TaxID=2250216 RepID=UPI000DCEA1D0|nr:response regulator transcription factor [Actinomyces sp. Z5]RAX19246.1 DNA-binding response regulator [Actinomyces sp. Z5]
MSTPLPARIIVVDDEPIIRDGLAEYLDRTDDIEVVARLSNGAEALDYLHLHHIDLVLMDVRMPIMDGPTALTRIIAEHPRARVVFMASFDDEESVYRVLSEGAHGYLLKSAAPEEFCSAIHAALAGGLPVSPTVNARILRELLPRYRNPVHDFGLSDRERQILCLLCQAASNREIAGRLSLSQSTVKAYVSSIMTKMGCCSRLHIVVSAFEQGLARAGS